MERDLGYLDRGGSGRGTYWTLRRGIHARLAAPGSPDRDRRMDWEAAKTRVLSALRHRARRGEPGMSNADIRHLTGLGRAQVKRLMGQLAEEGTVRVEGRGRGAVWVAYKGEPT